MISRIIGWFDRLWDRIEGPISDEDKMKIAAWLHDRREHEANLTFMPTAERDIGPGDDAPPTDHQPAGEQHQPPPAGGTLPDEPPRGRHAAPVEPAERTALSPAWAQVRALESVLVPAWFDTLWEQCLNGVTA